MRWKISATTLLLIFITFTAVAVNQLQNRNRTLQSEMNGLNQSRNEESSPFNETGSVPPVCVFTNRSSRYESGIILLKISSELNETLQKVSTNQTLLVWVDWNTTFYPHPAVTRDEWEPIVAAKGKIPATTLAPDKPLLWVLVEIAAGKVQNLTLAKQTVKISLVKIGGWDYWNEGEVYINKISALTLLVMERVERECPQAKISVGIRFTEKISRETAENIQALIENLGGTMVFKSYHKFPRDFLGASVPFNAIREIAKQPYVKRIWVDEPLGLRCVAPQISDKTEIKVNATQYPFKLTMSLSKTELKLGDPVNISLFLEYTGNENLTLVFSCGKDQLSFTVYDEKNSSVYDKYSNTVYAAIYMPTAVVLGWYQNITYTWYQEDGLVYQGIGQDPPAYYNKVSAGTYHIVGVFISHTLNLTIETPPITITILE